ncbi:MAG: replicative DNA helicase [Alistipes sp.]|nr:replicative DNA helicase [Alistipes sp.]
MYENAYFNERYVISAILYDEKGRFWPEIREIIGGDDFISEDCKALFRAACELLDAGKAVNAATVRAKAGASLETVKELVNLAPTAANIRSYAELVRKESLRRKAREIGEELTQAAGEESTDPLQTLTETARRLDDLTAEKRSGALLSGDELVFSFFTEFEERQKKGAAFRTFPMLDRFTGGFQPGRMYIFAARPGVGKSALGVALAQMLAKKRRVLYVSAEMSPEEITARIFSSYTGVPYARLLGGGEVTTQQTGELAAASAQVQGLKLTINRTAKIDVAKIGVWARQCGAECVFVDHVGLLEGAGKSEYERLTAISVELKRLARVLHVPMIVQSQFNRTAAMSDNPGLHQLRGTGALEQDADVCVLLSRNMDNPPRPGEPQDFTLHIAKNRHGRTGEMVLAYYRNVNRFIDINGTNKHDLSVNSWQ